ncbi:unnamed protein product [Effrenium voratum]|uniref:Uncharacterized protein n=1 Tax=Effrenium voratum TaxID=2562239 RepID=A0AA36JPE4_9DINO|nr:unnamed protein product [Effrenium voratum]
MPSGAWVARSQLEDHFSAPKGAPTVFAFWNKAEVQLTLRALRSPGAGAAFKEGRSFFISVWSPDVEVPSAQTTTLVQPQGWLPSLEGMGQGAEEEVPKDLGPWLPLSPSDVVANNLGGSGPERSAPELRYANAASLWGHTVDVVLRARSAYQPASVQLNGRQVGAVAVNVALGTAVQLELRVESKGGSAADLAWLFLLVYDVEDPFYGLSSAGEVLVSGVQAVRFPGHHWRDLGPAEAFRPPAGASPLLALRGGSVNLTLRALAGQGNSIGSQGRSFFLALRAPQLLPDGRAERRSSTQAPHVARLPGLMRGAVTTTAPEAQWVRQPLVQGYLGPNFALEPSKVVINNLGGMGPSRGPPELRWLGAAVHRSEPLDVVLTASSSYHPADAQLNGRQGPFPGAAVSVAAGTTVRLHLAFNSDNWGIEETRAARWWRCRGCTCRSSRRRRTAARRWWRAPRASPFGTAPGCHPRARRCGSQRVPKAPRRPSAAAARWTSPCRREAPPAAPSSSPSAPLT